MVQSSIKETESKIRDIKDQIEELQRQKQVIIEERLNRFPECCSEVCDNLNITINKIKENISKAEKSANRTPSTLLKSRLKRSINESKNKLNELIEFKESLYAKQICKC